jgi:perosamine synthetase
MNQFIPVNTPLLAGNEIKYLTECIETGWISSEGPFVEMFEVKFAKKVGRRYGIAVSNGSVALDVAISALGIGAGDEIILPAFTIISCAAAVIRAGAHPVLIDSDPQTWNMNADQIESRITRRTKAIMVVHIYGLPVDMDPVQELAEKYNLKIIEDAAEAHGLKYKNRNCGSFGEVSTFSFYPNKLVTTGEGGMVLTDDQDLAEKCRTLRNLCFQPNKRFVHEEMGWNFRMSNLQAALGVAQLEKLEQFINKKKHIGKCYTELLNQIDCIQLPLKETAYSENLYWVFGIVLNDKIPLDNNEVMRRLDDYNIGTRPFFWPMHLQPVFNRMGLFKKDRCAEAEYLSKKGFYLPSGLGISDDQIEQVARVLKKKLKI